MHLKTSAPSTNSINVDTLVSTIYRQEFDNFCKKATKNEDETIMNHYASKLVSAEYTEQLGAVLTPINYNTDQMQSIVQKYGHVHQDTSFGLSVLPYFKNVTDRILMLEGTYTITQALEIGEDWISKLGRNFCGMLIRSGDNIFNPYHPITAAIICNDPFTKKYKVVIYFYNDREALDFSTLSALVPSAPCQTSVNELLTSLTGEITEVRKILQTLNIVKLYASASIVQTVGSFEPLQIVQGRLPNNDSNAGDLTTKECLLVTHQVIAHGSIAPYYGSSLLLRNNSKSKSSGLHLGMCKSVNISSDHNKRFNTTFTGSVCVGSTDGISDSSLAVLNHANLGSPYNRMVMSPGVLHYIDYCIQLSRLLYAGAGLIKTPVAPLEPYTPDYAALLTRYEEALINAGIQAHSEHRSRTSAEKEYGFSLGWTDDSYVLVNEFMHSVRKLAAEQTTSEKSEKPKTRKRKQSDV